MSTGEVPLHGSVDWFRDGTLGLRWVPAVIAAAWLSVQAWLPDVPPACGGASGAVLVLLLASATLTDLAGRKIRNTATYPAMLAAGVINGLHSALEPLGSSQVARALGGIGWSESWLGGLLCFSGAFAFFLVFRGGAGDVKLMAALGFLLGASSAFHVWLATMLMAAAFGVGLVFVRAGSNRLAWFAASYLGARDVREIARHAPASQEVHAALRMRLPLAPFFTVATLAVVCHGSATPVVELLQSLSGAL